MPQNTAPKSRNLFERNLNNELKPWVSPLRGTLGSSLRSPAEGEGHEGFPPPPDKDLAARAAELQLCAQAR